MRLQRVCRTAIVIGLGLVGASFAELRVDRSATAIASSPAVAIDSAGSFVVVWRSFDRSVLNVVGQRFDVEGKRVGPEFVVDTIGRAPGPPAIGMSADGTFLMAWTAKLRRQLRAFGQFYDGAESTAGTPVQIDSFRAQPRVQSIAVAMNDAAESLVVWDDGCRILGQRFDRSGNFHGGVFRSGADPDLARAPDDLCGWPQFPSVSLAADGGFVVAERYPTNYGYGSTVIARRFDPSGEPASSVVYVGPRPSLEPSSRYDDAPVAAMRSDGGYVVAWRSTDHQAAAIRARLYSSNDAPGVDIEVVSAGAEASHALEPSVAVAADDSFLVVWRLGNKAMGRWYDAYGVELSESFTIGATPAQGRPSVTISASGSAVVAWESPPRRRSASHVFVERLMTP